MTDLQLTRWGARYGLTLAQVKQLQELTEKRADQATHFCNGDPHPRVADKRDKDANSREWDKDCDETQEVLTALAKSFGFDDVDYGVGLVPVLEKGGDTCIMVPGSDED